MFREIDSRGSVVQPDRGYPQLRNLCGSDAEDAASRLIFSSSVISRITAGIDFLSVNFVLLIIGLLHNLLSVKSNLPDIDGSRPLISEKQRLSPR